MKTLVAFAALLLSAVAFAQGAPARHRVITLVPSKDNTLYDVPDGSLSNTARGFISSPAWPAAAVFAVPCWHSTFGRSFRTAVT